jgi:hypothetical protein
MYQTFQGGCPSARLSGKKIVEAAMSAFTPLVGFIASDMGGGALSGAGGWIRDGVRNINDPLAKRKSSNVFINADPKASLAPCAEET